MGTFATGGNYRTADPRLVAIAKAAAAMSPYNVILFSGERNGNSSSQHSGGHAIDLVLVDPQTGREIPNLGAGGEAYTAYQTFANGMRQAQQQIAPELTNTFRWGGYFGPSGLNPTGLDLMHFDLGPTANMALGTWEGGLNENGRAFVAQAGNGQTYSPGQGQGGSPQPMAYAGSASPAGGQNAIAAATGQGQGLPAPEAPRPLFRPRSEAIAARQAGGTPRLDELSSIIQQRRQGMHPLLDRLRTFFQERGTPILDRLGEGSQSAPSPPAPVGGGSSPSAVNNAARQTMAGSASVRQIQQQLAAAGFDPGAIDGVMGPRTRAAVRAFQQANGLQVDGDPGPLTQAALARTATPAPQSPMISDPAPTNPLSGVGVPNNLPPAAPSIAPAPPPVAQQVAGAAPGSMPGMGPMPRPPENYASPYRPFAAGERVNNPDGTWSSERSMTVENPLLGGYSVIPSMYRTDNGPLYLTDNPELNSRAAFAYAQRTGTMPQTFPTLDAAEQYATQREANWQDPATAGQNAPLFNPWPRSRPADPVPYGSATRDYSIPVQPTGLPSMPTGPAPGSLPMMTPGNGVGVPTIPVTRGTLPGVQGSAAPNGWRPITPASQSTADLVTAAQGGDHAAIAELMQRGVPPEALQRYGIVAPAAPRVADLWEGRQGDAYATQTQTRGPLGLARNDIPDPTTMTLPQMQRFEIAWMSAGRRPEELPSTWDAARDLKRQQMEGAAVAAGLDPNNGWRPRVTAGPVNMRIADPAPPRPMGNGQSDYGPYENAALAGLRGNTRMASAMPPAMTLLPQLNGSTPRLLGAPPMGPLPNRSRFPLIAMLRGMI